MDTETTSLLLHPTDIVISTVPTGNVYNVKNDIETLLPLKADGNGLRYRDNNIISIFGDVTFTDDTVVSGRLHLLKQLLPHIAFIKEAKKLLTYEEYEVGSGLLLANKIIDGGYISSKGYGTIIHLKERRHNAAYRLSVWMDDTGKIRCYANRVNDDQVYPIWYDMLLKNDKK